MPNASSVRRGLKALLAALLAAAAVWLLCRWVGYDLQERLGNQPIYEILNDDYTQIIDLPEEGLRDLCGRSYDLTVKKLPKYVQREIKGI